MPTTYIEQNETLENTVAESFNNGAPIAAKLGDQLQGSLGMSYALWEDTADSADLHLIAGLTYTFTLTGSSDAGTLDFAIGDESTSIANPGDGFSVELIYTAQSSGTIAFMLGHDTNLTDYTLAVTAISYRDPTEGDDYIVANMTADSAELLGGDDTYIALGGSDKVWGGLGNDYIDGVCGNDKLWGDAGNDTILGGNGRDSMWGGIGDDSLNGQNQDDRMWGNDGNDTLIGEKGNDTIDGGNGNDDITGGKEDDLLTGGAGNDIFRYASNMGRDTITDFTSGEDLIDIKKLDVSDISDLTISQVGSNARINFGDFQYVELTGITATDLTNADFILDVAPVVAPSEGGDNLQGTNAAELFDLLGGSDRVRASGGDDTIWGGTGIDTIEGGDGNDSILGGSGADRIYGDQGNDTIYGEADNDVIYGGTGNDDINGGNANDRIYGQDGDDTLIGDNGNDKLWGGAGNDLIDGGAGKDLIEGGNGNDTIDGGYGDDRMTGGAGADIFVFDGRMRADTVTDFADGEDLLDMSAWGFASVADMTFQQLGADVFIQFSDRDSLLLQNVDVADLDNSDFIFDPGAIL